MLTPPACVCMCVEYVGECGTGDARHEIRRVGRGKASSCRKGVRVRYILSEGQGCVRLPTSPTRTTFSVWDGQVLRHRAHVYPVISYRNEGHSCSRPGGTYLSLLWQWWWSWLRCWGCWGCWGCLPGLPGRPALPVHAMQAGLRTVRSIPYILSQLRLHRALPLTSTFRHLHSFSFARS